jgi:hypothetical protein
MNKMVIVKEIGKVPYYFKCWLDGAMVLTPYKDQAYVFDLSDPCVKAIAEEDVELVEGRLIPCLED